MDQSNHTQSAAKRGCGQLMIALVFGLQIEKRREIFKQAENLPNELRILNRSETSNFKDKPALLWENVLFLVLIDH